MFRPRIIPVLTLKGKGLVKTVKFDKKNARYIGDPINAVKIFNDLKADELVFLDITAYREKRLISPELVRQIGDEAFMPFATGGGITKATDVRMLFNSGAEKVILCSSALNNISLIKQVSEVYGNQSVIVCVDVKKNTFGKYKLYYSGGTEQASQELVEFVQRAEEYGAGEILVNSIDNDGTMKGYDLNLVQLVSSSVKIPVIACGGAGSLTDLKKVHDDGNASAAAAGSLFVYHGARNAVLINYPGEDEIINLLGKESSVRNA